MKTKRFQLTSTEGSVQIMDVTGIDVKEIRFNPRSGNIDLVYNEYDRDELENAPYTEIKEMVEENGGVYENKKQGIEFLMSL